MEAKPGDRLSPREVEVLRGVADGCTNREIGLRLQVTEDTVKTHMRRIFAKLGARDRAHAVRLGMDGGALDPRRTKARISAVLAVYREARDEAPPNSLYARFYDRVKAALSDPPS